MSNMTKVIIGIVLPFLGTTLGSATVFFLKKEMNSKLQNLLRGFAAGVMIAASVWSLLIPSIDMAEAAAVGQPDSASAYEFRPPGRPPLRNGKKPYADACRNAA